MHLVVDAHSVVSEIQEENLPGSIFYKSVLKACLKRECDFDRWLTAVEGIIPPHFGIRRKTDVIHISPTSVPPEKQICVLANDLQVICEKNKTSFGLSLKTIDSEYTLPNIFGVSVPLSPSSLETVKEIIKSYAKETFDLSEYNQGTAPYVQTLQVHGPLFLTKEHDRDSPYYNWKEEIPLVDPIAIRFGMGPWVPDTESLTLAVFHRAQPIELSLVNSAKFLMLHVHRNCAYKLATQLVPHIIDNVETLGIQINSEHCYARHFSFRNFRSFFAALGAKRRLIVLSKQGENLEWLSSHIATVTRKTTTRPLGLVLFANCTIE